MRTTKILTTIILPHYGEENQLEKIIEKICNQTYRDIEIIIVDYSIEENIDKEKIKRKLEIEENKIKIIKTKNETNIKEEIKKQAEGKYIVKLNHIDEIDKGFIEKAVETGEKNNSDIILIENCTLDENNGNYYFYEKLFSQEQLTEEIIKNIYDYSQLHKKYLSNKYCKLYKTEYIKENNIDITKELTKETYKTNNISYIKEIYYTYKKIKEELISVIVPVYNVEKYIKECIDSIINQTYKNLEIILVNDGSTDSSGKICDKYAEKDKRIKVVHKENGGLSDARNKGLEVMTGEYVTFVDSDDAISENFLKECYEQSILSNSDIVIGYFFQYLEENNSFIYYIPQEKYGIIEYFSKKQALENNVYWGELNTAPFVLTWGKLIKAELFKNIIFPEGKLHEDEFTTHKLFLKCNKICLINIPYYMYRRHNKSIMTTYNLNKAISEIESLEEKMIDYILAGIDINMLRQKLINFLVRIERELRERNLTDNLEYKKILNKLDIINHNK